MCVRGAVFLIAVSTLHFPVGLAELDCPFPLQRHLHFIAPANPASITTEPAVETTPVPSKFPIKPLTLVQIAEKIRPSVVMLRAYNSEWEQIKTGTGFSWVSQPAPSV